ncbi:MAG: ATP-binding protein [Myxococcota bacterium]|jgi:predicted ATPase|nr:ATP-binding protein [Myxococcota bacterium]
MRIAISGSHRTGKSTLIEALSDRLPGYEVVAEPYASLEEEGHELSHPPTVEDFVAQLERSISDLNEAGEDVLFERCPLDFLAYLACHEQADAFELEDFLPALREALQRLDLVVFVPIEGRDRIRFSRADDEDESRALVHEELEELLLEDPLELGLEPLVVEGSPETRARAVLQCLASRAPRTC